MSAIFRGSPYSGRAISGGPFFGSFTGPVSFLPSDLGAKLILWYDAEDPSTMTMDQGVSSWNDKAGAYPVTQSTDPTKQPLFSANAVNGRPGLLFDGVDDVLMGAGLGPSRGPTGLDREIWFLGSQLTADPVTATSAFFRMGSSTTARFWGRRVRLNGISGFSMTGGDGATEFPANVADPPFNGVVMARGRLSADGVRASLNGGAESFTSFAASISSNTSVTVGALNSGSGFWNGAMNSLLLTEPLTDTEAANLTAYLKGRAGIP